MGTESRLEQTKLGCLLSEWTVLTIEDVCDVKGRIGWRGYTVEDLRDSGPLVLGATQISTDNRIDLTKPAFLSRDKYEESPEIKVDRFDILVVKVGNSIGKVAIVLEDFGDACINPNAVLLKRINIDPRFLFYHLTDRYAQHFLKSNSSASAQPAINQTVLKSMLVPVPSRGEQEAIAHILGTLDDRIELNRRMNATLEAMAQALFKSWFVDFDPVIDKALAAGHPIPELLQKHAEARQALGDSRKLLPSSIAQHFPDRFAFNEDLGWIPEGWEAKQVTDFGSVICGKTPSKGNASYYGDAIPFIKIPDMHHSAWITDTSDGLSLDGASSQEKKQIPANSICVSCIATVGKVVITSKTSHTNQQINSIVPHREEFRYYLYFTFSSMTKTLHDLASGGSATLNLNTGNFSRIDLLSPPTGIMGAYYTSVDSLFQKMLRNDLESRSLTNLRDTLLPKLLSGQLRIPDAEKLMEEAL